MSNYKSDTNGIQLLILLIESLILVFNSILLIRNNLTIDYHIHLTIFIIVFPFFFNTLNNFHQSAITKFFHGLIHPLWSTESNKRKTNLILIIVFIIPLIYLILHIIAPININLPKYISNWGIWVTTVGVFLTARIYMELKDKTKHSFDEFIAVLMDFMNESEEDDKILLILPTLFIGGVNYKRHNKRLTEKIIELAKNSAIELKIAIFDYDIDQLKTLHANCFNEKDFSQYSDIEQNEYTKSIIDTEGNSLLVKFHRTWNTFDQKNSQAEKDFYENLANFFITLDQIQTFSDNKFQIDKIKRNYFCKFKKEMIDPAEGNRDLFLYANITKKIFYIGNIRIIDQESIVFENSIINGLEIGNEFDAIYSEFVSSRG